MRCDICGEPPGDKVWWEGDSVFVHVACVVRVTVTLWKNRQSFVLKPDLEAAIETWTITEDGKTSRDEHHCTLCGALVSSRSKELHMKWHEEVLGDASENEEVSDE